MRRLFQEATQLPAAQQLGHKIRIVSYNILANKYSGFNSYCPPKFLQWSNRFPRLLAELESYQSDLLCLQEVEQTVYNSQLQPWMQQRGYSSLYHPRRSPADSAGPDEGVSLHFRTAQFTQVASQGVRFADESAAAVLPGSCCRKHKRSRFLKTLQQREEGCVMALLRHEPSQQLLLVCSTHLFWNPVQPDVKVAQAAIMCSSIAAFLQHQGTSSQQVPVIIAGDFNSMWQKYESDQWDKVPNGQALQSGVYQLMQQGHLSPNHQDHPANRTCSTCSNSSSSSRRAKGRAQEYQPALAVGAKGYSASGSLEELLQGPLRFGRDQWGGSISSSADSSMDEDNGLGTGAAAAAAGAGAAGFGMPLIDYTFTTSGLQLESSYLMAHGREPHLTTRTASFSGTLDYIWLSKQHWQVATTLAMPYDEPQQLGPPSQVPISSLGPCPNELLPSDHLAVGCDAWLLPVN